MINPFNPKYPVIPRYFAGRKNLIDRFKKDLSSSISCKPPRPENIIIVGEWGVGKTSLLEKFSDILTNEFKECKSIAVQIQVPQTLKNITEFVYLSIDKIQETLSENQQISSKIREEIYSWRIKHLSLGMLELEKKKTLPQIPASLFRKSLINLWKNYLKNEGIEIVLLMYDDIHNLVQAVKEGIYDLRSIFQELPKYGCNYLLILTGPKAIFSEVREIAEPVTRFFESYELKPFTLDEVKEAIFLPIEKENIPIKIDDETIKEIYNKTAGHPFFVTFLMRDLISIKKEGNIDKNFFNSNFSKIFEHLRKEKFERDLSIASEKEKDILKQISRIERNTFRPHEIKISNIVRYLKLLVDKGLITRLNRGEYSFYHPLFKEYLRGLRGG